MISNRKERRCSKKLIVSFSDKNNPIMSNLGVTSNISKNGLYIISNNIIPIDKEISILIATENDIISFKGDSKWNYIYPDSMVGTGVSIDLPPMEYLQFVDKAINV